MLVVLAEGRVDLLGRPFILYGPEDLSFTVALLILRFHASAHTHHR
jgi:hypothetical protein